MGAHEKLEQFLSASPKVKTIAVLAVIAVIITVLLGVFYFGVRSGDGWAASKYTRERDENLKRIAQFEQNERQLAAENALLKKQNETLAAAYKDADTKLERESAAKLADLIAERTRRMQDIDLDQDYDNQICGLCEDARRSGFPLSSEFCARCVK